jgi:hypothetical protein
MMSEKIRPHHLEKKAILYVRQSSAHQVLHNRESSALQYAMRDRLVALGWSEIETVDDDLGRSAAGSVARAGFDRRGPGGPALCPYQPRLAAAHRDASRRRHRDDRPGLARGRRSGGPPSRGGGTRSLPAPKAFSSSRKNSRRNSRESTRTGRKKPG